MLKNTTRLCFFSDLGRTQISLSAIYAIWSVREASALLLVQLVLAAKQWKYVDMCEVICSMVELNISHGSVQEKEDTTVAIKANITTKNIQRHQQASRS